MPSVSTTEQDWQLLLLFLGASAPAQTIQDGVTSAESIGGGKVFFGIVDRIASAEVKNGQVVFVLKSVVSSSEVEGGQIALVAQSGVASGEVEGAPAESDVIGDRITTAEATSGSISFVTQGGVSSAETEGGSIAPVTQDHIGSAEVEGAPTVAISAQDRVTSAETINLGTTAASVSDHATSAEVEAGTIVLDVQDRIGSAETETGAASFGVTDAAAVDEVIQNVSLTGEKISDGVGSSEVVSAAGNGASYLLIDRIASAEVISVSLEGDTITDAIASVESIAPVAASIGITDGIPSGEVTGAPGVTIRVSDGVPSAEVVSPGFVSVTVFITDGVSGDEIVANGTVVVGPSPLQSHLLVLGGDEEADLLSPEEFAALASGTAAWELGYSVENLPEDAYVQDKLLDDTMAFITGRSPSVSSPIVLPRPAPSKALALRRDADLEAGFVVVPVGAKGAYVRSVTSGKLSFIYDARWGLGAVVLTPDGRKFLHIGLHAAQGDPREVEDGEVIGLMGTLTKEAEAAARIAMGFPPQSPLNPEAAPIAERRYNLEKLLIGSSLNLVFRMSGQPEITGAVFIGALVYSNNKGDVS